MEQQEVSIADAKAHFSQLTERVSHGEEILLTKRGKIVARLTQPDKNLKSINLNALKQLTDAQPLQAQESEAFIRELRENSRY